jgi:hypothetical protein
MVCLNTIPKRNLSHRIKNGNRENRQPVKPKSAKQHKATKIKLKEICGGQLSGAIVLLPKNSMEPRTIGSTPSTTLEPLFQNLGR